MKKIRTITLTILLVLLFSAQSFATTTLDLTNKFTDAEQNIKEEVEAAEQDLMDRTYPVGSIYITSEDLSASDVAEKLGTGEWKEMKNTFLWARDADQTMGNDLIKGGKSSYNFSALAGQFRSDPSRGNRYDRVRFALMRGYGVPAYMLNDPSEGGHTPATVIASEEDGEEEPTEDPEEINDPESGDPDAEPGEEGDTPDPTPSAPSATETEAEFNFGSSIKVTEEGEEDIEILPPYTVVKMFRRTS